MFIQKLKKLIHFTLFFAKKDIKSRFAGSFLGILWVLIQPICLIGIYFFIFSTVLKIRLLPEAGTDSFLVFLLIGLFPWMAFQEGCIRAATSIIDNGEAVKKIPFPLESLPLGVILSSACIHLSAMFIFLIGYEMYQYIISNTLPSWYLLLFFFYMSLQLFFTAGIGFFLAAICTYLRDFIQIFNLIFQIWFYATPIVYPISMVPSKLIKFLYINPFTGLIESYRDVILKNILPIEQYEVYFIIIAIVSFYIGRKIFQKLKQGFADVL
jgi:ABC-type polysaccharide/polyol phosphate export permease